MKDEEGYILVTPCKNEEENLPHVITAVTSQTILPIVWVIVNDGSTDGSWEIINDAVQSWPWIKAVNIEEDNEYMGKNYSTVVNKGFDFGMEHCKKQNIDYQYIGLIDADNIPEKDYFEKLINEFRKNTELGIVSGICAWANVSSILNTLKLQDPDLDVSKKEFWEYFGSNLAPVQGQRMDKPMGSARLWNRKCFEATGNGYSGGLAPDSIATVKANLKGWKTQRFDQAKVIEREGAVVQGAFGGGKRVGHFDYFLGKPFFFGVLRSIGFLYKRGIFFSIGHLYGYIKAFLKNEAKIEDKEVLDYYKSIKIKESIRKFLQ